MKQPQDSPTPTLPLGAATARRMLRLTAAGMVVERVLRAFWPLWSWVLFVLALLALGLFDHADVVLARLGMGLGGAGGVWALIYGVRRFRWPSDHDARTRLDDTLPGRPLAAISDRPVIGADDRASLALWQVHQARMVAKLAHARVPRADLRLARYDLFGLRYVALILFCMSLGFGSVWKISEASHMLQGGATSAALGTPTWEGWAEPPTYTGKPALYLNAQPGDTPLILPQGSRVTLGFYGTMGALRVTETVSGQGGVGETRTNDRAEGDAGAATHSFDVAHSGDLRIEGPGGRRWPLHVTPDSPPQITALDPRAAQGQLIVPFEVQDDYGVVSANAEILLDLPRVERRYGLRIAPDPRTPLQLTLPLPVTGSRSNFMETLTEDLSQHPFANLPVTLRLQARDGIGQHGHAPPIALTLAARQFFNPLAASLIEMRRDLLWSVGNAGRVAQILRAITVDPEDVIENEQAFLMLGVAQDRLQIGLENGTPSHDLSPVLRDEIAAALWDIALLLEEGDLADAQARLRRAQEQVAQAIRNGASPQDIARLMAELDAAMQNYLQALADQSDPADGQDTAQNDRAGQQITQDQISQMMARLQSLIEEGRMSEAADLLDQINRMMENMRVTQGAGGSQTQGRQSLRDLSQTLRDQQGLADDAFRSLQDQPAQPGENGPPNLEDLGNRQGALRQQLGQQSRELPGADTAQGQAGLRQLQQADRAMREAERALRNGDIGQAIDQQAQALGALRQGLRDLGDAMASDARDLAVNPQIGQSGAPNSQDPLGRRFGAEGQGATGQEMLQGEDARRQARELLEDLRNRAGDQTRPDQERDYLLRLLDQF